MGSACYMPYKSITAKRRTLSARLRVTVRSSCRARISSRIIRSRQLEDFSWADLATALPGGIAAKITR